MGGNGDEIHMDGTVRAAGPRSTVYDALRETRRRGAKAFAVLIDPDKVDMAGLDEVVGKSVAAGVDYLLMGGSLVVSSHLDACAARIKARCDLPLILFPGSPSQVTRHADALLYLSLISGRNPELLIGQHVLSAPLVRRSGLEVMPTGYMLIDGGAQTSASYISNTTPIPADKPDIAACTAMAGEMLGLKLIYLDAGSGARRPVEADLIEAVALQVDIPLIVGGGITRPEAAGLACRAGADLVVVGNAVEKDVLLIREMTEAVHRESSGRRQGTARPA